MNATFKPIHLLALGSLSASLAGGLSGCVNPSARIASSLRESGFEPGQAQCVGDRLEANLSLGQLQQLGRAALAARKSDTSPGRLTVGDIVRAGA